jgi:hypothetical protein
MLFGPGQVVALLDPGAWDVQVADAPGREVPGPDGAPVTVHDSVVRAIRRAG